MAANSDLAAVGLGLLAGALWGSGDFSGGFASKKSNVFGIVVVSQAIGLVTVLAFAVLSAERFPPASALLWGAAAGVVGGIGVVSFYRALAIGQMRVVAPVTAVFTAIVPVAVAAITEKDKSPTPLQYIGFLFALAGVFILSRSEGKSEGKSRGLGLSLLAGLGFGGFLVLLHQAGDDYTFWPLVTARAASLGVMVLIVLTTQKNWRPSLSLWWVIALAGILDLGGNTVYKLASQNQHLAIASIMSSLYPAATVMLARVFLKEHVSRTQSVGILAALVSIILVTLRTLPTF